jgi:prephenate dehydratase
VGEHKLHICHSICCLPEDDWSTITEVHSHPVALMQCRHYLANHPELRAVETEDTAGAAEYISRHQCRGQAAICHSEAARLYGMKVLEDSIEDNKHNFTRFLVVCHPRKADFLRPLEKANKASLVFSLPHEEGSLSKVLTILSFYNINLTKIQSLPVIGHEWEYMFYVDVTYQSLTRYRQAIDAIMPLTKELKILGEYEEC